MNQSDKLRLSQKRFDPLRWIRILAWKHRWELFVVLVVVAMPGATVLLFNIAGMPGAAIFLSSFAHSRFLGWTLLGPCILVVVLVVTGAKRERRRSSHPVPPRPPGEVHTEPSTGEHLHLEQAERHAA